MDLTERGARFLLGFMAVLALLSLYVARPFLSYVLLGFITAFLLRNWQEALVQKTKRPHLAASLLVGLTILFLVVPFVALATALMGEFSQLAALASNGFSEDGIRDALRALGLPGRWAGDVVDLAMRNLQSLGGGIASQLVPTLFEFFLGIFIYFFVLFYGLLQGRSMVDFVRRAVPLRRTRMDRLLDEMGRALDAVFKGEILVALIQGTVAGVGWWLFGLPNPLLWGSVMTLLSIIPWTGAPLVLVPTGLWLIAQGEMGRGIGLAAFGAVLVGSIDNVLRPYIIGRSGQIHPAIVLIGVLGGLHVFGLAGIFLGPLVLVLLRAVVVVWVEAAPASHPA